MPFTNALRPQKLRHSFYGPLAGGEAKDARSSSSVTEAETLGTATPDGVPPSEEPLDAVAAVPRIVLDRETGGQFILGQNYPNPCVGATAIPFALSNGGDVRLDLFDLAGRKMTGIIRKEMGAGEHTVQLNLSGLGLPAGDYIYQLQVTNGRGVYRQGKQMTTG